jgi:alpha-galactosidase
MGLITNDEVLDIDQDELCKQALCVLKQGELEAYAKPMADGSLTVGLFNRGEKAAPMTVKWSDLKLKGPQRLRNVWNQKDLGTFDGIFDSTPIASHGVLLLRFYPVR